MNKRTGYTLLIWLGLSVGFGSGCRKKTDTQSAPANAPAKAAEAAPAPKLPGEDDVMAALEKKDYDGAMAALLRAKLVASTDEQKLQFMVLTRQAKDKLLEAAPTDAKAAEALAALRGLTHGR